MAVFPYSTEVSKVEGPPQGQWTYADWEKLPDDGNIYEALNGRLYVSTSPSLFHQWIVQQLYTMLGAPAIQQKLAFAFVAPIGLIPPGCQPAQPDFVVVLPEHASILFDRRIRGVPELIAEVLSPGTKDYDEDEKLIIYADCGVPEYVIIDPEQRQLRLYTLKAPDEYGEPRAFNEGGTVTFACLPTIGVTVSKLFEGAPDTTV
jgi:Uma2 family endonuclease